MVILFVVHPWSWGIFRTIVHYMCAHALILAYDNDTISQPQ